MGDNDALLWSFQFHYHRDMMNAAVHCAPVQLQPAHGAAVLELEDDVSRLGRGSARSTGLCGQVWNTRWDELVLHHAPLRAAATAEPVVTGTKMAVSCHHPHEFLIRAWAPMNYAFGGEKLVDWILHHIGRINHDNREWWGMTYRGQPSYMGNVGTFDSGLTIQHFVKPTSDWAKKRLEEGKLDPCYGPLIDLEIPDRGQVQVFHDAQGKPVRRGS